MVELYPHSVNTVRVITSLSEGQAKPFVAIVRMGTTLSAAGTDNWSVGGLVVAVDLETGRLGEFGLSKPGVATRTERHPDTGVVFADFQVPYIAELVTEACRLHTFFHGFQTIGWDVAITAEGPTFIEGNDDWGLQSLQGPHCGLKKKFLATLRGQ